MRMLGATGGTVAAPSVLHTKLRKQSALEFLKGPEIPVFGISECIVEAEDKRLTKTAEQDYGRIEVLFSATEVLEHRDLK